jgi:uncharacterized protein (UPF0335 family)
MRRSRDLSARERLVKHVQELERLQERKDEASAAMSEAFKAAKREGYDTTTLRVVLKLRTMTPDQRRERRALETIYLAALGMLEGDPLTDEARRRLDGAPEPRSAERTAAPPPPSTETPPPADTPPDAPVEQRLEQPSLILKDPAEARQEGADAAAGGKRIYDNPYPAGDPCRAAWDEGWCGQSKSHGMDTPAAYQRRTDKPPKKDDDTDKDAGAGADDAE